MNGAVKILLFLLLGEVVVTAFMAAIAVKQIRNLKSDNTYSRYIQGMLMGIALNNVLTAGGLIIAFSSIPFALVIYLCMRIMGLAIQGLAIILFCLYMIGTINGVGWFAKATHKTGPLVDDTLAPRQGDKNDVKNEQGTK
jgi:hypothetical protein